MADDAFGDSGALHAMFHPKTVAVVGATASPGTMGRKALATLAGSGFEGSIVVIDPDHKSDAVGLPVYGSFEDVPDPIDLAVVTSSGDEALAAVDQCAAADVKGVVVLSGVDGSAERRWGFERQIRDRLRHSRIKLIGPGCCAIMTPSLGLNVSAGLPLPVAGNIAFITQSGSLAATMIDASHTGIVGFSAVVSLGEMIDVGWGNLIDYFGGDWTTRAIVVHMESVGNMRSFLSAARAVGLQKPIVVAKAGRTEAAARAFAWHHTSRASDDEVFDAALRRVGAIRVDSVEDLLDVADALSKQPRPQGARLTIVSNAGGPGVLAADHAVTAGRLVPQTIERSDGASDAWRPRRVAQNLDVMGDGSSEPFIEAVELAARQPTNDALLLVLAPHAMSDPAKALSDLLAMDFGHKPALMCVPDSPSISEQQKALLHACFPVFATPAEAARTFRHMWRYSYDLNAIYETPELHADAAERERRQHAGELIARARRSRCCVLSDADSRDVLARYGVASVGTMPADGYQLQVGSRIDPDFGPVLWMGAGGQAADLMGERVVGLPPLNATLARRMLERSALFAGLERLANRGAINLAAIEATLVRLSQLVVEQPAIRKVIVNPLLVCADGAYALGAHIGLHGPRVHERDIPRPVIRPFPVQYVGTWTTKRGQTVTIRPVRPEDEPLMVDFHGRLSEQAVRLRYFGTMRLSRRTAHDALARACFVDYDREMVLVVEQRGAGGHERAILATASLAKLSRMNRGEIAVLIRDDHQRQGLGTELVRRLVEVARDERLDGIVAFTMTDNHGMCGVFRRLGFALTIDGDEVRAELDTRPESVAGGITPPAVPAYKRIGAANRASPNNSWMSRFVSKYSCQ